MSFTTVRFRYDDFVAPEQDASSLKLRLPTDGNRGDARLVATLKRPQLVRDALLTMGDVLMSDLRFKASDRSDYLAYILKQGKKATKELWEAQKKFLEAKYDESEEDTGPLDPVLTIDDAGLALEVFSGDESAYARLTLKAGDAYEATEVAPGTTHLDIGTDVLAALEKVRSYRDTTLAITPSAGGEDQERKVPHRWARALSQVQAASTLPAARFSIAPVDLYNVLLTLRLHRAKTSPRALRYELVPGETPRLVLEPWDLVLPTHGAPYEGTRPQVVRTWGRRRLGMLARILPHVKGIEVRLVGGGLPAYYVLDLGSGASLTVAMSGWTDSGWAGIATFDLLVAEGTDGAATDRILGALRDGPKSLEQLGEDRSQTRQALLTLMQRQQVLHDLATDTYVARPLFATPLDDEALKYRDDREAEAHRLLAIDDAVRLQKVHDLGGEGVRIEGEVEDPTAHRTYQTSFTLDREGRTVKASCTSPQFRRSGLKEGPTVPMIALRLKYARERAALEAARNTPEGRKLIRAETRTLVRREGVSSTTMRVSLDEKRVVVRWGRGAGTGQDERVQRIFFGSPDEARDEYFRRLERCAKKGFIDASAAEAV